MAGVGILAPTADPSSQGAPEQHYDLNQNMFGGGIARAGEEASNQVFNQALKFKQMENETWANEATSNFARDLGEVQNQYRQLQGLNRTNALREYQDKVQGLYQQYAKSAGSPAARLNFLTQGRGYADRTLESFGTLAGDAAEKAHDSAARGVIDTAKNAAIANYGLSDHSRDIDAVTNAASDYADQKGLTGADKLAYVQQQTGDVYESLAYAKLQVGDTAGARALLDHATESKLPGTDEPLLDRKNANRILHEVTTREQLEETRKETEDRRQEAAQRKAEADAGKAALDHYTTQMYTDPTKVDINAIANDPSLGKWEPRLKGELIKETRRILKGEDSVQDPAIYRDYIKNINADPGTPGRITDPRELVDALGEGKITYQTYGQLDRILNNVRTSELRGDNEAKTIEKFLSIEANKSKGLPDEANAALLREQDMRKAIQEGLHPKDSKTPPTPLGELIDPRSPKFVGKTPVENYMPQEADPYAAPTAAKPKPFTQAELAPIKIGREGRDDGIAALKAALKAGRITQAQAKSIALQKGWSAPPKLDQASDIGPTVPAATH